jgi:hypothetical protein
MNKGTEDKKDAFRRGKNLSPHNPINPEKAGASLYPFSKANKVVSSNTSKIWTGVTSRRYFLTSKDHPCLLSAGFSFSHWSSRTERRSSGLSYLLRFERLSPSCFYHTHLEEGLQFFREEESKARFCQSGIAFT